MENNKKVKVQLEAQARRIKDQLNELEKSGPAGGSMQALEKTPEDEADKASAGDRFFALKDLLASRLKSVLIALRKLRDKSYGVCDRCGEPISLDRLQAVPEATYCLKCEVEMEKV